MNKIEERTDNRVFRRRTLVVAGVLLLTALALYLLFRLRTLIFMVFVALFIAVALEPPVHFLEKRGWKRGLATGVVFLVVFLLIVAFVALLVPLFVNQFNELIDQLPGYIESVAQQLNDWFNLDLSTESLQQEAARTARPHRRFRGDHPGRGGQRHDGHLQLPLLRHHGRPLLVLHDRRAAQAAADRPLHDEPGAPA